MSRFEVNVNVITQVSTDTESQKIAVLLWLQRNTKWNYKN